MLRLPVSETAPKITLSAGRCLVAFFKRFGAQLPDDGRNLARAILQPLAERRRLSCDYPVHPFHWVGTRERQSPGAHVLKVFAPGVESARVRVRSTPRLWTQPGAAAALWSSRDLRMDIRA